jgi:hypothetical protein
MKINDKYINCYLTRSLDRARCDLLRVEKNILSLSKDLENQLKEKTIIEAIIKKCQKYIGEEIRIPEGEPIPDSFFTDDEYDLNFNESV